MEIGLEILIPNSKELSSHFQVENGSWDIEFSFQILLDDIFKYYTREYPL